MIKKNTFSMKFCVLIYLNFCILYLLDFFCVTPDPEVIKRFSCSTQLSTKFIMLVTVKMSTIVDILTFISMINTTSESLKARKVFFPSI